MPQRSGEQLTEAETTAELVKLLAAGASLEATRKELGLTAAKARELKSRALHEITQDYMGDAEAVLGMELKSLELVQSAAMKEALKGSPAHMRTLLRIMDHRAKLLGLYRPEQVEIRVGAVDDALQKIAQIIDGEVEVAPLRMALPPGTA